MNTPSTPLRGWALEFARRWNAHTYSVFLLHGNIHDVFPTREGYASLKSFLMKRLLPEGRMTLFYDIGDGLTFGAPEMQKRFFEWVQLFDSVEGTNFSETGLPRNFTQLAPLLRRFILAAADERKAPANVSIIIDFAEKIIPATEESGASQEERMALVTLLKCASSSEFRRADAGVILITESAGELHSDLLQNPHVAQVRLELPDLEDRAAFLRAEFDGDKSDLTPEQLAERSSGLSLLRVRHLLAEAIQNGSRVTREHVTAAKKRLIEEYCQGLVRFKDPKPGVTLDRVATHTAAKKKLREIAKLIHDGKNDVVERGILVPGRVGVGKSFLIDCFAAECGLPVLELGDFRSKWVGDTERQQSRILMTIRALGPVIVVVDEADAVFGNRSSDGDSGVSTRVFAAFAAHLGDSSLRGRELWVAMTSRPDLLAIDMKRQGRFGLSLPLFAAQGPDDVADLFRAIAATKKLTLSEELLAFVREKIGDRPLTGSDVESIVTRAKERAVLADRADLQKEDLEDAVESFIDPLDPGLLRLQELAAILSCSDKRFLPEAYRNLDRQTLTEEFERLRRMRG
jgi:SpoVK/Ycf46/Vps4 family AAA+-type ATPase